MKLNNTSSRQLEVEIRNSIKRIEQEMDLTEMQQKGKMREIAKQMKYEWGDMQFPEDTYVGIIENAKK